LVAAERPEEAATALAGTAGSALAPVMATVPLIVGRGQCGSEPSPRRVPGVNAAVRRLGRGHPGNRRSAGACPARPARPRAGMRCEGGRDFKGSRDAGRPGDGAHGLGRRGRGCLGRYGARGGAPAHWSAGGVASADGSVQRVGLATFDRVFLKIFE
jgi:hypothetical protein